MECRSCRASGGKFRVQPSWLCTQAQRHYGPPAPELTDCALVSSVERLCGGSFIDSLRQRIMGKIARNLRVCNNVGCSDCPNGLDANAIQIPAVFPDVVTNVTVNRHNSGPRATAPVSRRPGTNRPSHVQLESCIVSLRSVT